MNSSIVARARAFATRHHSDQRYGNGESYIWHLEKVVALVGRLGYDERIQAAAWLHDVVEDTPVEIEQIREEFGEDIAAIVEAVTYSVADKRTGGDKIAKAKQVRGAQVVKFCDAAVNFSASALSGPPAGKTQQQVTERYGAYLAELRQGLPTPEEIAERDGV